MTISPFDRSVAGDNISVSKLLLIDLMLEVMPASDSDEDCFDAGYHAAIRDILFAPQYSLIAEVGSKREQWERQVDATRKQMAKEEKIIRQFELQQEANVPARVRVIEDSPVPINPAFDDPLA